MAVTTLQCVKNGCYNCTVYSSKSVSPFIALTVQLYSLFVEIHHYVYLWQMSYIKDVANLQKFCKRRFVTLKMSYKSNFIKNICHILQSDVG